MHVEMSTVSQYERNNSYCNKKGKTEILVGQTYSLTLVTMTWYQVPTSQEYLPGGTLQYGYLLVCLSATSKDPRYKVTGNR